MKVYVIFNLIGHIEPIKRIYKTKDAAIRDRVDYLIDRTKISESLAYEEAEHLVHEHEVLEDY